MTVTEITIFNLKKAYTNEELAKDSAHKTTLETVKAAKGCEGVTWSVLDDDPKALAWLVGESPIKILGFTSAYKAGYLADMGYALHPSTHFCSFLSIFFLMHVISCLFSYQSGDPSKTTSIHSKTHPYTMTLSRT